ASIVIEVGVASHSFDFLSVLSVLPFSLWLDSLPCILGTVGQPGLFLPIAAQGRALDDVVCPADVVSHSANQGDAQHCPVDDLAHDSQCLPVKASPLPSALLASSAEARLGRDGGLWCECDLETVLAEGNGCPDWLCCAKDSLCAGFAVTKDNAEAE